MYIVDESEHLAHHGIKGMKWGVRRYQNEDGSLTAAGKKRYGDESSGKMSYRQIKNRRNLARKQYAKDQGKRLRGLQTGSESTKVYEKYENALTKDKDYQSALKEARYASVILDQARQNYERAAAYSATSRSRSLNNPDILNLLDTKFANDRKYQTKNVMQKAKREYITAENKARTAHNKVAKKYIGAFRNATVSELGFKNVSAGRKILNDHNYWDRAFNMSITKQDMLDYDD